MAPRLACPLEMNSPVPRAGDRLQTHDVLQPAGGEGTFSMAMEVTRLDERRVLPATPTPLGGIL